MTRHLLGGHQRLAHQRIHHVQQAVLVPTVRGGHRHHGGQVEPAGEHRNLLQHLSFVLAQQVVGPAHRLTPGLVAFQATAWSRQQPEPVVQAGLAHPAGPGQGHQLVRPHHAHQFGHLGLAAHEAGDLFGQVPGQAVKRTQSREATPTHLEHVHSAVQVRQAVLT
jgi:hypothetical protein